MTTTAASKAGHGDCEHEQGDYHVSTSGNEEAYAYTLATLRTRTQGRHARNMTLWSNRIGRRGHRGAG